MKTKTLPQRILVTHESAGTEDEYFQVTTDGNPPADIGDKKNGAWYILQEHVTVEGVALIAPVKRSQVKRK